LPWKVEAVIVSVLPVWALTIPPPAPRVEVLPLKVELEMVSVPPR
jgi:hypothetical protein